MADSSLGFVAKGDAAAMAAALGLLQPASREGTIIVTGSGEVVLNAALAQVCALQFQIKRARGVK